MGKLEIRSPDRGATSPGRAALEGKLSAPIDVQTLTPLPAGMPAKGAL